VGLCSLGRDKGNGVVGSMVVGCSEMESVSYLGREGGVFRREWIAWVLQDGIGLIINIFGPEICIAWNSIVAHRRPLI
jgi:hypothetical protein